MKNKFCVILKSKIFIYIFLAIIILSQIAFMTYGFATEKMGYHSDEMYSYGLSNSYHNPFLSVDGDISSRNRMNTTEWVSGSIMNDYLVVNDGEAFDYANVWYNQSLDRHPPLYYAVLHTVCSFFPNQFSPWFGFSINLVFFAITQFFLFLIARKLMKSNWLAVLVCICYGFSVGAVNVVAFIRMYAMLAMWVTILAYLHLKVKESGDKLNIKVLLPLLIITALGALTQHEFTVVAYSFAICFCLHYLMNKDIKNFFKYGFTMLGGVLLSWAIFPAMPKQIFSEGGHATSFELMYQQIYDAINYIFSELFGLSGIWAVIGGIILLIIMIISAIICSKRRSKDKTEPEKKLSLIGRFMKWFAKLDYFYMGAIAAIIIIVITTIHSVNFIYMGYCDRYLFSVYPLIVLLVITVVTYLISAIKPIKSIYLKRGISTVLFLSLLVVNVICINPTYYFKQTDYTELKSKFDNNNVIVLEYDPEAEWRMVCFSYCLMDSDKVFFSSYGNFIENLDKVDSLKTDKTTYLLLALNGKLRSDESDGEYLLRILNSDMSMRESIRTNEFIDKYCSKLNFYKTPERQGVVEIHGIKYLMYVIG